MRKRFEIQHEIGATPVDEIEFPKRSRDELPAVLRGLQYIYITSSLNSEVFELLESKIGNSKTGRPGMSFWEILVLGTVRLTLDVNYDRLEHIANYDRLVREMLGVETKFKNLKKYPIQTLKDNICLLTEELLEQINDLVVSAGHKLKKKSEELAIKVDSYAVESNVHFPTDLNLLWDACRKCTDLVVNILSGSNMPGWRKHQDWKRRLKRKFRIASKHSAGGGKNYNDRLEESVIDYLELAEQLSQKIKESSTDIEAAVLTSPDKMSKLDQLKEFEKYLDKQINLIRRRIIYKEKIPHEEKMFSLFETYTEWIKKGKAGNKVELGLKVAVSSDQFGFVVDHRIMEKENDVDVTIPIAEKLLQKYPVKSISYDKGFWSGQNYTELSSKIEELIMPKKGRLNKEEYTREHKNQFIALRKNHSAVESDINSLEHHGLNRCPDKSKEHFIRYVALGVLSYNLHKLGNILIEKDRKALEKKRFKESQAA